MKHKNSGPEMGKDNLNSDPRDVLLKGDALLKGDFVIDQIDGPSDLKERLYEMGLFSGVPLSVMGQAPFGGPILVQYQSCFLALRLEEFVCLKLSK